MAENTDIANLFEINDIVGIKEEDQIRGVVEKYKKYVVKEQRKYYAIDVHDAMTKLATCGVLIQLSYASTDGFPCQKDVAKLLSQYQSLVKNSYIASAKFVLASINALDYHRLALKVLSKKATLAIKMIAKCSKLAEEMAVVAGDLSVAAGKLADLAETALVNAVKDKSVSVKEREDLQKTLDEVRAKQAELAAATQERAAAIQQIRAEEEQAVADAKAEAKRKFIGDMVKTVIRAGVAYGTSGVSEVASAVGKKGGGDDDDEKQQPKSHADRAAELTKQRLQMQQTQIEQNADLAKQVSMLGSYTEKKDQLKRALKSIEIAIKTLGKIKVIFTNTKMFWEGVKANCDQLVKNSDKVTALAEDDDPEILEALEDDIKEGIVVSGVSWFILCKVNYDAKQAIMQVDKGMDSILNDLPDESEALQLVDTLSKDLKQALNDENAKMVEEQQAIEGNQKK